jgi:hypothetical protein
VLHLPNLSEIDQSAYGKIHISKTHVGRLVTSLLSVSKSTFSMMYEPKGIWNSNGFP